MSQTILITGTSSGFGKLMTKTLLEKGHKVVASMRDPREKNKASADELKQFGTDENLLIVDLDVTNDQSVNSAVNAGLEKFGKIDALVNNAGIGTGGITEGFTPDQFTQLMNVNVSGLHRVTRAVLPSMREHGNGLIINISSVMGRIVIPFATVYTASKFAVEGYTESLRYELGKLGIDVVSIEPGGFMTGFFGNMLEPADKNRVESYGEYAKVPDQMWEGVGDQLTGDEAPNPQEVADAVFDLVELPRGKRPLRVVVDPMSGGEGPKTINETTEQVQKQLLEAFGLN